MKMIKVTASEFQAKCLKLIADIETSKDSITITKRGRPVAVLGPAQAPEKKAGLLGAMKGSVLRYDAPTEPAIDPDDWAASH